ncbi:MAG TPA: anaerobic ribonucleoside-triphosphate reductase activating protein [Gammaproteobacteria bacterium]|nr:anaerobic ribonucleoside-triphosphate reductase activating protein [Gammaproteobacteria bacterium]
MNIGGLQKFSLIDYPDQISAIVFTRGCDFRCGYCYNAELVLPERYASLIPEQEIMEFLKTRRGKLDAVVITGGEPTVQPDLLEFILKVKALGFLVKLDTNGINPRLLEKIIEHKAVDYIAMDIKAPLEKYQKIINVEIDINNIMQSIRLIMHFGIDYEFRTTIVKSQLGKDDIVDIAKLIQGARLYALQKFVPDKVLDVKFLGKTTYSDAEFEDFKNVVRPFVAQCLVR